METAERAARRALSSLAVRMQLLPRSSWVAHVSNSQDKDTKENSDSLLRCRKEKAMSYLGPGKLIPENRVTGEVACLDIWFKGQIFNNRWDSFDL